MVPKQNRSGLAALIERALLIDWIDRFWRFGTTVIGMALLIQDITPHEHRFRGAQAPPC